MTEKPLLNALAGKPLKTPPIWLMRQAGRYLPEYRELRKKAGDFLTMCYTPQYAAEVTLQPIRRFGFDGSIIFSDILVVPHAMGRKLSYQEKLGPVMEPLQKEDIIKLNTNNFMNTLAPVGEALARVKKELPAHTALIGFAGAPWTVATYMVEGGGSKHFDKVKTFASKYPEDFERLMDALVEVTSEYLLMQVKAGAEVLQVFDSWAGLLDEEGFERWVINPTKKIVERVKKSAPNIPIIGFPKGAALYYPSYIEKVKPDAVGLDYTVPTKWAAAQLQTKLPVQGNLDPTVLLSDEKTIQKKVKALKECFGSKPYIFNLGHGILPQTPIENVETLLKAVREND